MKTTHFRFTQLASILGFDMTILSVCPAGRLDSGISLFRFNTLNKTREF